MKKELIGNAVTITFNNKQHYGKVINETKNTLKLLVGTEEKTFIKKLVEIECQGTTIQGKTITKRPENRIKK